MAASGINHFLHKGNLSTGNFKIYYDFKESGVINSVPSGDSQFSGDLSSQGDFFNKPGSGYFTGQTINVNNVSLLDQSFWTHIFAYSRPTGGNHILFSSFNSGGNIYSGYLIGINDANRLYFESYDNQGPVVRTFTKNIADNNIVSLSYFNNNLSFSYYNPASRLLETESYSINGNYLFPSDKWTLGGHTGNVGYIGGANFTGYIDDYLYFDSALTKSEQESLFSGFICNKLPDQELITTYTNYPITGYQISGTSFELETGYNVTRVGTNYDNCGNEYPVYYGSGITGVFSGNQLVPLTGIQTYEITGYIDGVIIPDSGYIRTLGYSGISYLRKIDTSDITEILYISEVTSKTNNPVSFNFATNKYYNVNLTGDQILYANGLCAYENGGYVSGNAYNSRLYLSGDYLISGGLLETTGFLDQDDTVIFDNFNPLSEQYTTGYSKGSGTSSSFTYIGKLPLMFFNGQKLLYGRDYYISGPFLYKSGPIFDSVTGNLHLIYLNYNNYGDLRWYVETGIFANNSQINTLDNTEMVWLNGQRQLKNEEYLLTSNISLLNGSGVFGEFQNIHTGNLTFTEFL